MKRLTFRCTDGRAAPKKHLCAATNQEILDRLSAYEDTGLEPEEIQDLMSVREISPEAEYAINKHAYSLIERMDALLHEDDPELEAYRALGPIDHLRELVRAEKDGRMVVLPCAEKTGPPTNADRIRAMSDEELAKFVDDIGSYVSKGEYCTGFLCVSVFPYTCFDTKECCEKHVLDWLQQPAEEVSTDDG